MATDRFGIRVASIPLLLLLIASTYALYVGAERLPSALLPLYLSRWHWGTRCGTGSYCYDPRPPAVRFTGVSFSYNISYAAFGGVTPPLVSWLAHLNRLGPAHYLAVVTVLGLLDTLMAPTTQPLEEDFSEEQGA